MIRYEDFQKNPVDGLRRLCRHFRLELTEAVLAAGVAVGSKENMARHQEPNIDERPVRLDSQGDTRFSPETLAMLGNILHRHLRHDFGYRYFEQPRGFQIVEPAPAPPLRSEGR